MTSVDSRKMYSSSPGQHTYGTWSCTSPDTTNEVPLRSNINQCFFQAARAVLYHPSERASKKWSLPPAWRIAAKRLASKNERDVSRYLVSLTSVTTKSSEGGILHGKSVEVLSSPPFKTRPGKRVEPKRLYDETGDQRSNHEHYVDRRRT